MSRYSLPIGLEINDQATTTTHRESNQRIFQRPNRSHPEQAQRRYRSEAHNAAPPWRDVINCVNGLTNQTYVRRVDQEEHRRIDGNRLRREFAHGHPRKKCVGKERCGCRSRFACRAPTAPLRLYPLGSRPGRCEVPSPSRSVADVLGLVETWRGPVWRWELAAGPDRLTRVKIVAPSFLAQDVRKDLQRCGDMSAGTFAGIGPQGARRRT
jgi:hypothetical protein